jgi:predicted GIY-YIG superfamily endonuclease
LLKIFISKVITIHCERRRNRRNYQKKKMEVLIIKSYRVRNISYYTGHTDSIDPRISAHAIGEGSGYTSTRLQVKVVFVQEFAERCRQS